MCVVYWRCCNTRQHTAAIHTVILLVPLRLCQDDFAAVALYSPATQWNALQHAAKCCNTLQHIAAHCITLQYTAIHCDTLQHTATHGSTLQRTATHCNTLQMISTQSLRSSAKCTKQYPSRVEISRSHTLHLHHLPLPPNPTFFTHTHHLQDAAAKAWAEEAALARKQRIERAGKKRSLESVAGDVLSEAFWRHPVATVSTHACIYTHMCTHISHVYSHYTGRGCRQTCTTHTHTYTYTNTRTHSHTQGCCQP